MKLYNTLTRVVQDFNPQKGERARIYSCGPTVYDHAHIGNLSAYIFADTLRRAIALSTNMQPIHAMNYTDVDDKTIRRAIERYPNTEPTAALHTLTDEYINVFHQDMQRIGNDISALTFVRATDRIEEMKQFIVRLHGAGFAYTSDDGVYFSISAYQDSGKTYGQLLEITVNNTSEQRIQNDEYDKDNIHDFALWKKQKPGEPSWEFNLDGQDLAGRPGWHIECSVMSRELLGQPFDIHTGGVDLIFPHHENEIAQSTALEDSPIMATFFTHNEHILVDGKKMSKSLNNFYTLQDIVDKEYDPLAFRLLVLQAHYRSQVHFSWENLEAAQNRLDSYRRVADLQFQPQNGPSSLDTVTSMFIERYLLQDLDTPRALASLSQRMDIISANPPTKQSMEQFRNFLKKIDDSFGLDLARRKDVTAAQKQLIRDRGAARQAQDWQKSDDIRAKLTGEGIGLRDTPQGAIWFRL